MDNCEIDDLDPIEVAILPMVRNYRGYLAKYVEREMHCEDNVCRLFSLYLHNNGKV